MIGLAHLLELSDDKNKSRNLHFFVGAIILWKIVELF